MLTGATNPHPNIQSNPAQQIGFVGLFISGRGRTIEKDKHSSNSLFCCNHYFFSHHPDHRFRCWTEYNDQVVQLNLPVKYGRGTTNVPLFSLNITVQHKWHAQKKKKEKNGKIWTQRPRAAAAVHHEGGTSMGCDKSEGGGWQEEGNIHGGTGRMGHICEWGGGWLTGDRRGRWSSWELPIQLKKKVSLAVGILCIGPVDAFVNITLSLERGISFDSLKIGPVLLTEIWGSPIIFWWKGQAPSCQEGKCFLLRKQFWRPQARCEGKKKKNRKENELLCAKSSCLDDCASTGVEALFISIFAWRAEAWRGDTYGKGGGNWMKLVFGQATICASYIRATMS